MTEPLTLELPIRLVNETNAHEHWRNRARRAKAQRALVTMHLHAKFGQKQLQAMLPVRVTLARIAPRALDDDNHVICHKSIRDGIAAVFGVKDNNPVIQWVYGEQRRGAAKYYGESIVIERLAA